jgi:hypothetical protein
MSYAVLKDFAPALRSRRYAAAAAVMFCVAASVLLLAPAGASCSKPGAPSCASTSGNFANQAEYEQCRVQVENYNSEIKSYLACQRRETTTAIDEHNEAVDSFNRRVRGH